jgi:hypothetical protein
MEYSGARGTLIHEKKLKSKTRVRLPLNSYFLHWAQADLPSWPKKEKKILKHFLSPNYLVFYLIPHSMLGVNQNRNF